MYFMRKSQAKVGTTLDTDEINSPAEAGDGEIERGREFGRESR